MKPQSALQTLTAAPGARRLLLALLLLAGAALSTTALAASGFSDCDRLASNLRSLDVPTDELPLDAGEHATDETGLATADGKPPRTETGAAPVLLLTPRVADIVREVFDTLPEIAIDDGSDIELSATTTDDDAAAGRSPAAGAAPVVRAPSLLQIAPPGARNPDGGGAQLVPRLQSPMYRTDI